MNADLVRQDFSSFSDPGTDVIMTSSAESIAISMIREGENVNINIEQIGGKTIISSDSNQSKFSSIGGLLASPFFADIKRLSETQKKVFSKFVDSEFIEPEGVITDKSGNSHVTIDAINSLLLKPSRDQVRVVLLDGQAGVGKTSLIRRLLVKRATENSTPPIIHVESLGSRLFGLNHLLAASLDSLRAKFTFDQVPTLVRYGLIQIAIDGFDELADSEGYADAWSALSDFISDIGTGGGIILAGRDTFFDQQTFGERLADSRQNIDLIGVRLSPITTGNARSYLKDHGWSSEELNSKVGIELLRDKSYILRPFFLRTLADEESKSWSVLTENNTIRNILVDRFLNRESNIIRTKTSLDLEHAKSLLSSVFSEVALELAASEANAIDTTFIELLVEAIFSDAIPNNELGRLTYKAGSIAFLEPDQERRGYRRFPHTEISNYFLAHGIINGSWSSAMRRTLGRASLLVDFFSLFSEEFSYQPSDVANRFITMIETAIRSESSSSENLGINLASLWIATLSHGWDSDQTREISNIQVSDAAIVGEASRALFDGVTINRLDLRGADVCSIRFSETNVSTLLADENTRFGESTPSIAHIQVMDQSSPKSLRGNDVTNWIQKHSRTSVGQGWLSDAEALLWRVASTLTRRYVIRDSIADPSSRFLRDRNWKPIEDILMEFDRIERSLNKGGGPQDEFVRIIDPVGLLRREDKTSRDIWNKVQEL